ncbi:hypothetical protein JCM4814A_93780 [Streptomyces phaeofaciens JCM 4814]
MSARISLGWVGPSPARRFLPVPPARSAGSQTRGGRSEKDSPPAEVSFEPRSRSHGTRDAQAGKRRCAPRHAAQQHSPGATADPDGAGPTPAHTAPEIVPAARDPAPSAHTHCDELATDHQQ